VRAAIAEQALDCLHEVDGGIGPDTIARAAGAGADTFVAGHSVFRAADAARPGGPPDPVANLRALREALRPAAVRAGGKPGAPGA
jgi:ribulose-phosphate 3-epimerase